jgi:hypothetical protein
MITFLRAHKHVISRVMITFSLIAFGALWLSWCGPFRCLLVYALLVMLFAAQLFWIRRVIDIGERFIPGKPRRAWLAVIATVVYVFFFAYNFAIFDRRRGGDSTHLMLRHVLFEEPFWWWLVGSWVGFGLVIMFWTVDRTTRAAAFVYRKASKATAGHAAFPMPGATALDPPSPARRRLLEQTAVAVGAVPFVAAAYGLLHVRLDVEVTRPRIGLHACPKPLRGFVSPSFRTFTSAPSPPRKRFGVASQSPTG